MEPGADLSARHRPLRDAIGIAARASPRPIESLAARRATDVNNLVMARLDRATQRPRVCAANNSYEHAWREDSLAAPTRRDWVARLKRAMTNKVEKKKPGFRRVS